MNNFLIIPVLNEEESIAKVLNEVDFQAFQEIIIIDNGSTDKTWEILQQFSVTTLLEPKRGYGQACLKGLEYISHSSKIHDNDNILFIDGDYSDNPQDLNKLIVLLNDYEFVIGTRMRGEMEKGAMPIHARFGNWLSSSILGILYSHYKFSDLGPMRGVRWGHLKTMNMIDTNFGWTIEMQIKALKMKLKCIETPVQYKKRVGVSKISGNLKASLKAGFKILYSIYKYS